MIFTADKLKEARDAGYSDDEIFSFASQSDTKFNDAKSEGYSLDEIASYFSTQQPEPMIDRVNKTLEGVAFDLEDTIGIIGRIPEALATQLPAGYQRLVSGTAIPKKNEAIEADLAFQARNQKELEDRKASGELGPMASATMQMLPSIGTSLYSMGAGIAGGAVGLARGLGNPITAAADAGVASGVVSYRMQGADYLYRAFKQLEENKGSSLTDQEKTDAYKVLLPLSQESALWEAGPEAVGNAVSLGVGKFVFGFGKQAATQIARESAQAVEKTLARKIAEKSAAVVGGSATEVGTETITAIGQYAPEMAAKQYAETGTTKGAPTEYPGGIMQAAKDVAPATLATQALFMGAGGAVKLAALPFEAKPKTPVQIATDNIDLQANKEATNLAIDPTDEAGKGLSETINSIQSNLVNKKEVYSVLEATDPVAQTLKLEIQEDENRLILMQAELNKRAGVEITEAEKQQIELAKAIAAPEVAAPITPEPTEVTTTEVAVAEAATPVAATPAVTEAPAAEVVTIQRDVNKPEQMTPEEFTAKSTQEIKDVGTERDKLFILARKEYDDKRSSLTKKNSAALKRISRLNPNGGNESVDPNIDSAGKRIVESLFSEIEARKKELSELQPPIQSELFDAAANKLGYQDKGTLRQVISNAITEQKPVSSQAVDTYGITLPEGYTKQGDLYVYQPAVSETITPAAEVAPARRLSDLKIKSSTDDIQEVAAANDLMAGQENINVPANELKPLINLGDPKERKRVDKLKEKILSEDGFISRVIVDGKNNVVEGQHRVQAMKELGYDLIPAVQLKSADDFIPDSASLDKVMRDAGLASSDKRNQARQLIAEIINDEKGDVEKLREYEAPTGIKEVWSAAIEEVIRQNASPTPAVSETITPATTPKLQREKADTDFASIDEITDIIQESAKGTDKSESKIIAINLVKNYINESIDWVRDTFGSAPEKVGFDASQMKKWLQNAVSIRPVTEDEFTRGIIKKKGQLTKEGRDRGKIDVSVISPMESRMIALHEASHFLYHLDEDKQIPEKVLNSIKNKRLMPDKFPNPGKGIKERFADAFTNWAFTKMHPEYANEFPTVPQEFVSWIESEAISEPLDYISSVNKIRKQKQAKPKLGEKGGVLIPSREDFIQAGQNIYEKGMEFGAWAKQMIQQFGDVVREFLGDVWQAVSGAPAKLNELMGYLPGKGETGAVNIGQTEQAPIEPEAETITEAMAQGLDIGKEDNMPINNKIESHIKNFAVVRGFFESASDRLRRAGFKKLATAIDDYYDQAQRRLGFANKILLPAFDEYAKQSKANKKKIDEEVKMFYAAQENKRDTAEFFDELNPVTQKIVTAWQKFGEESGKDNQRIGIKVFDRGLQRYRPIGRIQKFFPRILKPEYKRALMEPDKYQKEYNEIVDALIKSGRIEKPEEAERYISNYEGTGTQKDYFSGIESARGQALPEELYDYSMQVMTDYVARWSQHASRIEQFGQKLGENSMTLWDRSRASTRDRRTIDYITAAQERVEGYFPNDPFQKGMAALNIWASGLQLGNPASATMNMVGGTTLNAMIGQPGAASSYVESLIELRKLGSNLKDAREKGIISRDLMNIVGDHQQVLDQNGIAKVGQKTSDFLLKWSGFTPVEQMIRTQSLIIGKSFLRKTLSSFAQNPDSSFSKQASTWLSRNNFDIDKLLVEQGSGPETDKLMRYFATASQGGYTISQTPIFIDTPIGKFLFKYQKFSTQVMRQAWKNTFEPAWKAVTFKGETMQLPSETRQLLYRLRLAEAKEIGDNRKISLDEISQKVSKAEAKALTLIPVMMWLASAYVGGEAILRLRDVLFGVMMKGPDYEDILKALEDDEDDDELYLGLQRAWYNLIGIGALGLIGNYGQFFMDWQDRERVKNPLDPPALSLLKETGTLITNVADQGTLTKGDINNYLNRMSSMYRVSQKLYQTSASGLGFSDAPTVAEEMYRREVADINKYARRWAESAGLEYRTKRPMDIAPSKMTPINREISSYLQRNDPVTAAAYAKEYLKTLPKEDRKNAIQSMESGARNRQPLRLGSSPMDEAEKREFLKWAKAKMSPEKYAGIEKLAKQYESNRKKFLMRLPNR
jgi:hypothetical protein